jgi:hypothetical protein
MQDAGRGSDFDQSTLQLVIDQLEEFVVTLIEEIRERPAVAAAILAGVLGAIVGTFLAARAVGSRPSPPRRVVKRARGLGDAADLAGLAMRLLENPIVRAYARAAVANQFKRRFSM